MKKKLVKLIVECDIDDESEQLISEFCCVKYSLPSMGYYVVEVSDEDYHRVANLNGIRAVHKTARITAQKSTADYPAAYYTYAQSTGRRQITGKGIGIAILDTGVGFIKDLSEPENRIIAFKDFIGKKNEPYDDNAHGTHVAGIAAGNGMSSNGLYTGIAPESNIIGVKILDSEGKGDTAEVMAGIQWIISNKDKYNIRVANLSVGTADLGSGAPLVKAVEAAWDKGIIVCVAAGNNGPGSNSVTSPGISRKVITVGSSEDDALQRYIFSYRYTHG